MAGTADARGAAGGGRRAGAWRRTRRRALPRAAETAEAAPPSTRRQARQGGDRSSRSCSRASSATSRCRCPCSTFRRPISASPAPSSAIEDNNTTGRFLNQKFTLDVVEEADADKLIKDVVAEGRCRRALRPRRRRPRHASEARRCAGRQGRRDHQLRRARRPPARGGLPPRRDAHGAHALHARRRARAVPHLEEVEPLVPGARARNEKDKLFADAIGAPPSASAARSSRSAPSTTRPAAGAPTAAMSRCSSRSRPSRRAPPTTTSSSSPTKATCSAIICPTGPGMRGPVAGTSGLVAIELAPGHRAVGRHAIPEPLQAHGRSHHAPARLQRLDGDPHDRRGRLAHEVQQVTRTSSPS